MNAIERVVAEVFADALEREEPPGPDDSIFSLGGDSLSAVRAALALERRFDVEVPPELMEEGFERSRIGALDRSGARRVAQGSRLEKT